MISDKGGDLIIDRLENAGYQAYYVGGCVRNHFLGLDVNDFDITTNARPNDICSIFKDFSYFTNGIKHGTVSLIIDSVVYEVTTFRTKEKYVDHRRPSSLDFCDNLHEDLARRDFTINAMAFNKKLGVIDDFNGIYDLNNRILRSVNDPFTRFKEDALRILRGMRFCSTYNLVAEESTKREMINCASDLNLIASERINFELSGVLLGDNVYSVLTDFKKILFIIIPELEHATKMGIDLNPYFNSIAKCSKSLITRLSILLLPSRDFADKILRRLKFDAKTINLVKQILLNLQKNEVIDYKIFIKNVIRKFGFNAKNFLEVYATANNIYLNSIIDKEELFAMYDLIIANEECCTLSQLKVNGNDLKDLGFEGVLIKERLEMLLNLVIEGKLANEKSILIGYIKNYE